MFKANRKNLIYAVILFLAIIFIISGCNSVFPPMPGGNIYLIISTAGLGGTISPLGETSVAEGSSKIYTISPEEDYEIYDVQVDGESMGTLEEYTFTNIQGNHTIVANFLTKPASPVYVNPQKYQINASSTAGGIIQPEGTFNVIKGGDQIFVMVADPGHEIVDVLVDGISVGAVPYYIFDNVKEDHTIEAIFIQMFSLTMAVSGEGSTAPAKGTYAYPTGTVVNIQANPASGCFSFTGWSGDVTGTVNPTVVTMDDDKYITATFQLGFKKIYNSTTGNTYNTIQDAIDDADSYDTIYVCPGIYYENIEFNGKSITVKSANPFDPSIVSSTIIDGSESDSVVKFINLDFSWLTGFTIRNGSGINGGGIYVEQSSPEITRNVITNNNGFAGGGGIYLNESFAYVSENTITNNKTSNPGGGIYITTNSNATILNNIISNNTATDTGGGIMVYDNSSPTINGNTISNNRSDSIGMGGGGICVDGGDPLIKNNIIIGNIAANDGGGIHTSYCSSEISDNNIIGNSVTGNGGGLYLSYGNPEVLRNKILDNEGITAGGGISIFKSASFISENMIQGNKSHSTGGGISARESGPHISFNMIKNNDAPQGGGINLYESTSVIDVNVIVDNTGVYGAGMFVYECSPVVILNEFYNNLATNEGGGIFVSTFGDLLPDDARTSGWGYDDPTGYRQNIPNSFLVPIVDEEYVIAGNKFLWNKHEFSSPNYYYYEGAHVYFDD